MIGKKIEKAFNEQINAELFSSYLYLAMAGYFEDSGLPGFSNWLKCQAQEELLHAMKFFNFIVERGGRTHLTALDGPANSWKSAKDAFDGAYKHECYISKRIDTLVNLAAAEKDHAANAFLQWFVTEQVEEEASTKAVVDKLKLAGKDGNALLMLDKEMTQRVFTLPPAGGESA